MSEEPTQVGWQLVVVFECRLVRSKANGSHPERWLVAPKGIRVKPTRVHMLVGFKGGKKTVHLRLRPQANGRVRCTEANLLEIVASHRHLISHPELTLSHVSRRAKTYLPKRHLDTTRALLFEVAAFALAALGVGRKKSIEFIKTYRGDNFDQIMRVVERDVARVRDGSWQISVVILGQLFRIIRCIHTHPSEGVDVGDPIDLPP
jgi:hypothetical protein